MIILIFSSTMLGLLLSDSSKKRITVCSELASMCDMLLLDLDYRVTPVTELLKKTLKSETLRHISFISNENVMKKCKISSCLSKAENDELSGFLYALGKSDIKSQKRLISGFKEYIKNSQEIYSEKHRKDSKLYVTFGFFFGIVISLIWS